MSSRRTAGRVTVLLVDDHAVVREGYRRLLEGAPGMIVVGEAASSEEALQLDRRLAADVIVLDIALPDVSGIETLRRILARRPAARVLIFSMHQEAIYASRALQAGATGYISKSSAAELLVEAVRRVAGGMQYVSPDVCEEMSMRESRVTEIMESLSDREHEVLRLLTRGHQVSEIGRQIGISAKTVANLQTSVKRKLGADTALQLLVIARQLGLS